MLNKIEKAWQNWIKTAFEFKAINDNEVQVLTPFADAFTQFLTALACSLLIQIYILKIAVSYCVHTARIDHYFFFFLSFSVLQKRSVFVIILRKTTL